MSDATPKCPKEQPLCERCGTPKINMSSVRANPFFACPLPEAACQAIAALRSEVEALRKRNEELDSDLAHFQTLARERGDALWRTGAHRFYSEDMPIVAAAAVEHLETELQELKTKLRAAEDARKEAADAAVVLTEVVEQAIKQNGCDMLLTGDEIREMARSISATSALAAQRKREIQREAVEAAWHRIEPQFPNHPQTTQLRAAILGEEEP